MQYLNDDMNDLIRQAAKNYPINLPQDDWNTIARQLTASGAAALTSPGQREKRKKGKVSILLLLSFFVYGVMGDGLLQHKGKKTDAVEVFSPGVRAKFMKADVYTSSYVKGGQTNFDPVRTPVESIHDTNAAERQIVPVTKPVLKLAAMTAGEPKIALAVKKNEARWYIGLMAGPQFNQVKNQQFSGPGINAGLIMGLNLNKKMAIETGLFVAHKNYSSSGEYFDMQKLSATMPAGMKLISLTSQTTIFEIPVKFKYDVTRNDKGTLFITSGISSYLLTSESNHYHAALNGSQENFLANYSNRSNYFMAAANISAGYEHTIGKGLVLRLEPYIQIPLKGVGVGSLPVLSAGLNIGIVLPVRR